MAAGVYHGRDTWLHEVITDWCLPVDHLAGNQDADGIHQTWSFPLDIVDPGSLSLVGNSDFYIAGVVPVQEADADIFDYGNFRRTFQCPANGPVGQHV